VSALLTSPCHTIFNAGPYILAITGVNNNFKYQNVMFGDVWLCSVRHLIIWTGAYVLSARA